MNADFGLRSFRVFRDVYECVVDDLIATYGGEFKVCDLRWESALKNRNNNDLILLLSYRGEAVLSWEIRATSMEYYWRRQSRLN